MTPAIIILIIMNVCSLVANLLILYMSIQNVKRLQRIIAYGDSFADIQKMLKDMGLEHHRLVEEMITETTEEILKHITFTNRWQKVMAKMIRVKGATPLEKATGVETIKEAEELHEIGLEIAKTAFDDKQELSESSIPENEEKEN